MGLPRPGNKDGRADAFPAGFVSTETLRFCNDSTSFEIGQRAETGDNIGKYSPGQECSYLRSNTAHGICQDNLSMAR